MSYLPHLTPISIFMFKACVLTAHQFLTMKMGAPDLGLKEMSVVKSGSWNIVVLTILTLLESI